MRCGDVMRGDTGSCGLRWDKVGRRETKGEKNKKKKGILNLSSFFHQKEKLFYQTVQKTASTLQMNLLH
jgi:hypothetical protein